MRKSSIIRIACLLALSAPILTLPAAVSASDTLPQRQTQGEAGYVTGGVGQREAVAMRGMAADYALEIVCMQKAMPRDQFLAGVAVQIQDARGNQVLDVTTAGPYLLADLPPGRYTISAAYDGATKTRPIRIAPGRHLQIVLRWDG